MLAYASACEHVIWNARIVILPPPPLSRKLIVVGSRAHARALSEGT